MQKIIMGIIGKEIVSELRKCREENSSIRSVGMKMVGRE